MKLLIVASNWCDIGFFKHGLNSFEETDVSTHYLHVQNIYVHKYIILKTLSRKTMHRSYLILRPSLQEFPGPFRLLLHLCCYWLLQRSNQFPNLSPLPCWPWENTVSLKVHLHEIFYYCFFIKAPAWSPD
jgi:hypothetical protein